MISLSLLLLTQTMQPAFYQPSDNPAAMILAEVDEEEDTPKPKPKRKPKPKPSAPKEALTTPAAPIPYAASADKTPSPVSAAPTPSVAIAPPIPHAEPAPAAAPPPPAMASSTPERLPDPVPPPERIYIYPLVDPSNAKEISLRCDTLVFAPDGTSTRGIVRLSLIPSLVNPSEFADIHVMAVDIGHASIIRDTACEAYRCSVAVTPTFYSLTVVDKRRSEIKVTLNRQTGAFYGYEKQAETTAHGLITLKKGVVTNENGWCVPEAPGKTLF